jgi:autotransporter-associated beta strand protein
MSHSSGWIRATVCFVFALTILVAFGGRPAAAETLTYVGPNGGQWSVPANWSPAQGPADGDDLVFNTALTATDQDLPNLEVRSLTFVNDSMHTVSGNAFRLTHGLSKAGIGGVSIPAGITISQGQTWSILGGAVSLGSLEFENATLELTGDGTQCSIGPVTGTGGITKSGAHTLDLTSSGTFAGPVTVDAGMLLIGHPNSLGAVGAGNGTTINANATLRVNSTVTTLGEPLTLNGAGYGNVGALWVDNPAAFEITSPVVLSGPATVIAQLGGNPGGTIRFIGSLTGPGGLVVGLQTTAVIEHASSGFETLDFSGTGGVLRLTQDLGGFSGPMSVTVPANNSIDLAGNDLRVLSLTGGGTIDLGPGAADGAGER